MFEKILFIDRDGTLISEPKKSFQVDNFKKLIFEPNVITTLSILKKNHYKFVMITNQDGLGSKQFPLHKFNLVHNFMLDVFLSQGIKFKDILICPHTLQNNCICRKPQITMLKSWLKEGLLDKNNSYVIGDRQTDMELAKNMNITGIQYGKNISWNDIQKKLIKKNRTSSIFRQTKETKVHVELNLDNYKNSFIDTKIKFLDHMLEQIAIHSNIYLKIYSEGDWKTDDHHTVEDIGIVLGKALKQAIGNKLGINRFGFFTLPMDESIASCILDISGRPHVSFYATFKYQKIGDLSTEMIEHFFQSLSYSMNITIHLNAIGKNDHHIAESLFKAFGRSLKQAIIIKGNKLPTSKGML
ncbi:imidazoleglycerol-phosphate dehydratase [Buchnera aphidicola (Nipponaphis monzeni)]|uniref:Imidazoleglycerol-phosphate dehydratase n=1 Tax=Buchnera aphidicola (Nipponaphis monzeni) TaxID=2495405 RepID=A0A455T9W2_9GAMM|nr:bifunctional histidinol-phosphatase/imidazoleglycerol-phosphate dehydratase HisB [Buchnera aphidicola]BBI01100.1 imidazoleglycerol-phosphate dehydratase [Buchnera aphidicola (Nipponaphis monzeni)]